MKTELTKIVKRGRIANPDRTFAYANPWIYVLRMPVNEAHRSRVRGLTPLNLHGWTEVGDLLGSEIEFLTESLTNVCSKGYWFYRYRKEGETAAMNHAYRVAGGVFEYDSDEWGNDRTTLCNGEKGNE